jgi:hypothetical protein
MKNKGTVPELVVSSMAAKSWLSIATPAMETVSIAMGPEAKVPV